MKIRLLIASKDHDYVEHLSRVLTERDESVFEVTTCTTSDRLTETESKGRFDIALLDREFATAVPDVKLCFLLWAEDFVNSNNGMRAMRKYQRISRIVSQILEGYAEISDASGGEGQAKVSIVWAPSGGCGKTTVSLAYAAQQVAKGKKTTYLNLEPFSSEPVYFSDEGKSISSVFAKLDSNVSMLLHSIRQEDSGSGIGYFHRPDNYDDIAVLTEADVICLVDACATVGEEVVVDLGSGWNEHVSALMERADSVFVVIDGTRTSQVKWEQFCEQHNFLERVKDKLTLVANRGAQSGSEGTTTVIRLPLVRSEDPIVVYKTLSARDIFKYD